jgi:hypothetical protein
MVYEGEYVTTPGCIDDDGDDGGILDNGNSPSCGNDDDDDDNDDDDDADADTKLLDHGRLTMGWTPTRLVFVFTLVLKPSTPVLLHIAIQ